MSYSNNLELLKGKIQKAEEALSSYLATGIYDPHDGKKLIEALGAARDEFISQLAALGPDVEDCGHWHTPSEFRHYASRILDGYSKFS